MKIAISNTVKTPYPIPKGYINGGLWVAGVLADQLSKRNFFVDFYTAEDSVTYANKVSSGIKSIISKNPSPDDKEVRFYEEKLLRNLVKKTNENQYDLVNFHNTFSISSKFGAEITNTPTIYTLHDPISDIHKNWSKNQRPKDHFICISDFQKKAAFFAGLNVIGRIYNGIEIEKFSFNDKPKDFIAFLARMDKDKGVDVAIEFGKKSGENFKMAGRIRKERDEKLAEEVLSYKGEKNNIEYLGSIEHEKVGDFLKDAKALIFPTQVDEPFGLSMVEAMACGTPVIAFRRGAVPEIVKDGITGYIIEPGDIDGMIAAVKKIDQIDRAVCRKHVEDNFTVERMVDGYEKIYQKIINR